MSYTFGASNADDITVSLANVQMGADNGVNLVAGWWYPTTLTAGHGYFSCGATHGMEIDTTTDELRFHTANATTDGTFTTSAADIIVNKWQFIAAMWACETTGALAAWRLWVGDVDVLNEVTVTQTVAPVGAFSGAAPRYVGNLATSANFAFQGDIGWVSFIQTGNIGACSAFGIETSGVITDANAELNLKRWVRPLWQGNPNPLPMNVAAVANAWSILHFPLDGSIAYGRSSDVLFSPIAATINGATLSQNLPPRYPPANWPHIAPYLRRAA